MAKRKDGLPGGSASKPFCYTCGGTGTVNRHDYTDTCPRCKGSGREK